jgi:AcrR family transcriptional regulator
MDLKTAETRLLDVAEELFYERGVRAVGMDDIRAASGVSLKRLYQVFPAKERLVEAVLERRSNRGMAELVRFANSFPTPRDQILGVFDYLYKRGTEPGFRGCAFINSFGEMGGVSEPVADIARGNKLGLREYLGDLVAAAGLPAPLTDQLVVLANGAMSTAGILNSPEPAIHAKNAAAVLLDAATTNLR